MQGAVPAVNDPCTAVQAVDHLSVIAEQARTILADAEREVAQPADLTVVRAEAESVLQAAARRRPGLPPPDPPDADPASGGPGRTRIQAMDTAQTLRPPAWLHCGGMPGPFFDGDERAQLADLLDELGPDAPTLLAPWTTRDIAAHLVLRERDPLAGPGLVLPGAWSRPAQRRQVALAARDFTRLVATFRAGPPPGFFRAEWVRRVPSLNEFFVHHEDVRRANGRGPRANEQAMDEALWHNVSLGSWYLARRLRGTGLELHWAGTAKTVRARRGQPVVRVAGPPGELLLYLFGRQDAAQVEVSGPASAVEAVRHGHLRM